MSKLVEEVNLKEEEEDEEEEEEEDQEEGKTSGASAADKKKKKKNKKKGKKEEKAASVGNAAAANSNISATGRAILLKKQQLAEEEARIKALQEAEEKRIRELEEKEAEERRLAEEIKEKKRKAKQDKIDAQKAAGTYMTKSEKEKQKKAAARIEAMKAAGMIPVVTTEAAAPTSTTSTTTVNHNKHKKNQKGHAATTHSEHKEAVEEDVEEVESPKPKEVQEESPKEPAVAVVEDEEPADDWDAIDEDEIATKFAQKAIVIRGDEDTLENDRKAEQERLKQLGIERSKRDEEARLKREEEEKERAEMERKEREAAMRKETSKRLRREREAIALSARSADNLRRTISVIMGHVDTGKTKLLDKIRHTNVQEGEAGGITQQIGATQFSKDTLTAQTNCLQKYSPFEIKIPGLLVIDTPGHESFSNLRSRGSSLCDIAILVIDLMHGMEPQTLESLNMLKRRKTPFIVALNKVDRCYGWKSVPDRPIREALEDQDESCRLEFKDRASRAIVQLMEQGLNAKLYWENDDPAHTVSLVPTSAITGEGVPDLLMMLITLSQTGLQERLMYHENLQCTVLEVKQIDGLGHTLDAVLVNGTLHEGDTIIVSTLEGPVVTNIRAILTPPPNMEMRIKSEYIHHQSIKGAIGVKIVAPDVQRAVAGTPLMVLHPDDDLEELKEETQSDLTSVLKALSTEQKGVIVHASTLGALEALLQFLRDECDPPIPVCYINIGTIHKKDVIRAGIMHEKNLPEFATILAFDVKIDAEAASLAQELNVRVFTADIIYHLFDQFTAYINGIHAERRKAAESVAVYPCVLKILPQHIFNKKDPIVMGVEVTDGILKLGTMLCVPSLGLDVGRVVSIENNHKEVQSAKKGLSVSIKISNEANPTITYGRQFDHTNALYSKISRESIDALKNYFKSEVSKEDWQLIIKLKKVFSIA